MAKTEFEATLDSYRAEIASLEARARELRGFAAGNPEANLREAATLDEEASSLRRSLASILPATFR
jgi:hypothetical protein